jgi:hypothetical protein
MVCDYSRAVLGFEEVLKVVARDGAAVYCRQKAGEAVAEGGSGT